MPPVRIKMLSGRSPGPEPAIVRKIAGVLQHIARSAPDSARAILSAIAASGRMIGRRMPWDDEGART